MTNNLRKVKQDLCTFAKRTKDFKYTDSALITFLMSGMVSVASNLFSATTDENLKNQRQEISSTIKDVQQKVKETKRENNKLLKSTNLELIQLMEQGDHVVKSPWSSWQYGANTFLNNWNGTYKGRGDKKEKYRYEGVLQREKNVFGRTTTVRNDEQRAFLSDMLGTSAINWETNGNEYGLLGRKIQKESPHAVRMYVSIRPKQIQAISVNIQPQEVNLEAPTPTEPLTVPEGPQAPNIKIPSFSPVAPKIDAPELPTPPTFAIVLGADCNDACDSHATTPRQKTKSNFLNSSNNKSQQNISSILHYTWPGTSGARQSYAFKMFTEESNTASALNNAPDEIFFNSYNFGYINPADGEFQNPVANSSAPDKNHQRFLIGGSRFIEIDNYPGTYSIPSGKTIQLGGIYVLGIAVQDKNSEITNKGTFTDKKEKDDQWVIDTPNSMTINAPTETITLKKSTDGYLGYKVAMAQVEEDGGTGDTFKNEGIIDFYGSHSIGLYSYLPNATTPVKLINETTGKIFLSGESSYGMRLNSSTRTTASELTNKGEITLRKNPDSAGVDRADGSAAMALMADGTVIKKVRLLPGQAKNTSTGTIKITDNVSDGIGMFINIDSNMTNEGKIEISAKAGKKNNKYRLNSGMRADQVQQASSTATSYNTTVINAQNATIELKGEGAAGMIANSKNAVGQATAENLGNITISAGKENYGMLATNEGKVVNETTGKIDTTGSEENAVGIISLLAGTGYSEAENKGEIIAGGTKSTGVYNTGHFLMDTAAAKITASGNQSIAVYAKDSDANTKTMLKQGTIEAKSGGVGLYSDKANITLNDTSGNLKLIADDSGLLFYNYDSDSTATPATHAGKFTLETDVNGTIKSGGVGFYIKDAAVSSGGAITGIDTMLDSMFSGNTLSTKMKMDVQGGGSLIMLYKPAGGAIKLSLIPISANVGTPGMIGDRVEYTRAANNAKAYSVYRGELSIDQDSNLDNTGDPLNQINFVSSKITVEAGKTISGTGVGQMPLFQGNFIENGTPGAITDVSIINKGNIKLSGNSYIDTGTPSNSRTTVAMAGDYTTLTNQGKIEVTGEKAVGIFGSSGSLIRNENNAEIKVGKESVGIYAVNQLAGSKVGDKKINIYNNGKIYSTGAENSYGIFAHNDTTITTPSAITIADAVIVNDTNGVIDMSNSKKSIGIDIEKVTLTNNGKIKVGEEAAGLNVKNSNITSNGEITLTKKGIGINLVDAFTGRTLSFSDNVIINGDGNSIYNIKNSTMNPTILTDNITVTSNNKKYSYFSLDNSVLTNTNDKTLTGDNITFVSGKNSQVDWGGNLTLSGKKNVAFYMDGVKTNPEIKTAAGKTITLGNESIGAYVTNGARVENNADIVIGDDGAALYSVHQNSRIKNTGALTLGKNTVGINVKRGAGVENTGTITSTSAGAKGIVVKEANPLIFSNDGKINLTGASSVGVYLEGGAHSFTNKADITIGNSPDGTVQSVGIYAKPGTSITNTAKITAGRRSVGIYGNDITLAGTGSVEVGDGGLGIYSQSGNVNLNSGTSLKVGQSLGAGKEGIGVYYGGTGTVNNQLSSMDIGKGSIGFVMGNGGTLNNKLSTVDLKGDSIYTYTSSPSTTVNGYTAITTSGDENYGYYVAGDLTNESAGTIDLTGGIGNVGIYSYYTSGSGTATNKAVIKVGATDASNSRYGIGMAAGYSLLDNVTSKYTTVAKGHIVNEGDIYVNDDNSVGMFASGNGSMAENRGKIYINGKNAIGMYLENKAVGINHSSGEIIINPSATRAVGAYVTGDAVFKNYGTIRILANDAVGITTAAGGTIDKSNYSAPVIGSGVSGAQAEREIIATAAGEKLFGNVTFSIKEGATTPTVIKVNGVPLTQQEIAQIDTVTPVSNAAVNITGYENKQFGYDINPHTQENLGSVSKIGMYIDTSGINFTNPIEGIHNLSGIRKADLIIGAEAAEYTNAKAILIGENILQRYNQEIINNPQINEWNIISGSLTWAAAPNIVNSVTGIKSVVLAKTDYKEYANKDNNAYNFLDGLEQRYGVEWYGDRGRREKILFNKLNNIGKREEKLLSQAFDEMMGHQYANVQQRINATGNLLDKEFNYLKRDWRNPSKQNNKIKVFGMRDEYRTDTAGIIDYTSNSYGVAYVHEDEKIKIGNSSGWYAGAVTNRFKFKDIGKSKENQTMLKAGVFKTMSPKKDYNGALQWTVGGDIFAGINDMKRRYLIVDDIFEAKSDYHSYGAAIKTDLGYDIRTSERTHFRPYGALKMEYGKFNKIKEDRGEMRLEVKENDYFSVKPEVGVEFKYVQPLAVRTNLSVGFKAAYENELGKVGDADNRARVGYTTANWFGIRGEKEDRRGNGKFDLNIGVDNTRFGITVNGGYDTKGNNIRGGIGFRAIY